MGTVASITMRLMKPKEFKDIWPLIEKVVAGQDSYHKDDIIFSVSTGEMQAHVVEENGKICFAAITQFLKFPRNQILFVPFGGGKGVDRWKNPFRRYLEGFARKNNCSEIQMLGRLGWAKVYPHAKTAWAVYRFPL